MFYQAQIFVNSKNGINFAKNLKATGSANTCNPEPGLSF
jgi:hypothetical protein